MGTFNRSQGKTSRSKHDSNALPVCPREKKNRIWVLSSGEAYILNRRRLTTVEKRPLLNEGVGKEMNDFPKMGLKSETDAEARAKAEAE